MRVIIASVDIDTSIMCWPILSSFPSVAVIERSPLLVGFASQTRTSIVN